MDTAIISFPLFGDGFAFYFPNYFLVFGRPIYFYGVIFAASFALAALYLYKRRDALELTNDNVLDLVLMAVPFGLIGARIYYVVFNPSHYFGAGNWQNIVRVWEGGLAVYGGIIGAIISYCIYARVKKIPIAKLLDAGGFGLFIGQAAGRWGNFVNREAFGVETDLPWRMGLTTNTGTIFVHPAFLYESLWNIIGLIAMHTLSKKQKRKFYGQYFLIYVAWYGLGRFMIEGLRTDSLYLGNTDIRISQLLAAVSCVAAVAILVRMCLLYKSKGGKTQEIPAEEPQDDAQDCTAVEPQDETPDSPPEETHVDAQKPEAEK